MFYNYFWTLKILFHIKIAVIIFKISSRYCFAWILIFKVSEIRDFLNNLFSKVLVCEWPCCFVVIHEKLLKNWSKQKMSTMDHLFRQGDRREGCLSRCAFSSLLLFLLVVHTAFSYCYWNWYSGDLLSTQNRKALSSSRNNSGELPLRIILPIKFIIGPRSPYFLSKPMLLCT